MRLLPRTFATLLLTAIATMMAIGGGITASIAGDLLPRYRFVNLSTAGQAGVNTLLEDQQGFIWAGTQDGLYRIQNNALQALAGLPRKPVHHLLETADADLWIAHAEGLARWSRRGDAYQEQLCDAKGGLVQLVRADAVYALGRKGVLRIDERSGDCQHVAIGGLPAQAVIERIGALNGDLLLAVRDQGLYRCTAPCTQAQVWAPELAGTRVRLIARHGDHLFAGTHKHGLFQLDVNGRRLQHWHKSGDAQTALPVNGVMSVATDRSARLWIGLWAGGLIEIDERGARRSVSRHVAADNTTIAGDNIKSLLLSRHGVLYAGHERGVSVWLPDRNQWQWIGARSERQPGLLRTDVQSVYSENENVHWLGTAQGGLYRVDRHSETLSAFEHVEDDASSFPSRAAWSIRPATDGTLLVGTSNGIVRMDPRTQRWSTFTQAADLPGADVYRIAIAPDQSVWASLWSGGIAHLDAKGKLLRRFGSADGLRVDTAGALEVTRNGDLFVLNSEGVFRLRADASEAVFENIVPPALQGRARLLALSRDDRPWLIDDQQRIWIWHNAGEQFVVSDHTLPTPALHMAPPVAGAPDRKAIAMWLLGTDALTGLDANGKPVVQHALASLADSTDLRVIGNLQTNAGIAAVGAADGIHFVPLDSPPLIANVAAPQISGLRLFNRPLRLTDNDLKRGQHGDLALSPTEQAAAAPQLFARQLTLAYDQDVISFEFAVPGLSSRPAAQFRYRLTPFDRDWLSAPEDESRATYTRLPPGEYQFQVEASWPGHATLQSPPFTLHVAPPWWLTWWAKSLAAILVGLAGAALMTWRTRTLQRRNKWLEERVSERTAALETANRRLQEAAERDALTGLYNRRGLRQMLHNHWQAHGKRGALFIGDIDHFKQFNDTHGHQLGDEVLVEIGRRLRAAAGAEDCLARWGGEEFLILLSGDDALARADALRRAIGDTPMPLSIGPTAVTMTAGVVPFTDQDFETALRAADALLYEGKHCGRDRLIQS